MINPLLESLIYMTKYYGASNSPEALISGLPLEDGKLTPILLEKAAQRAGLISDLNETELQEIDTALLPCILLLNDGNSCVLIDIDKESNTLEVVFPSDGTHSTLLKTADLEEIYQGYAFYFKRKFQYDDRSPEILKMRKGHWFWGTLWESKHIYRNVLLASILLNLFAIALPLFTRIIYDKIVPNLAFESLWVLSSGIFIVFVFDYIIKSLRNYFIDIAGKKSDLLISSKLYAKVMGIRMESKPKSVGSFAKNLQEFESIREFFTSSTVSALIDLPFAFFFLGIIYLMAGPLVLVPIVAVTLLIIRSLMIQPKLQESIQEGSRLSSQKYANLIESISGLETIKLFGAQNKFQYKWEEAIAHMSNWGIKSRSLTDSITNFSSFIQQMTSVGLIVYGVYLISTGDLTMGGLIAASMLSGKAIGPLVQLSILSTRYFQAKTSMTMISEMMASPNEQEEGKHYIHRPVLQGKIEINNVSFSYPEAEQASLSNISLTINPGEKVAILGRIGSGKTTLERLITGLYKPTSGSIQIDGTNISQLHHIDIRRNIGCVPQDITLFHGSIRENIIFGRNFTDEGAIMEAANLSGVLTFTQRDPAGLERQVGEGGLLLSGGQRQAVAIARALLGNPPVLLMDEPTSSMDNRTESYIKKQIARTAKDKTLILITHKLSMLDVVDRVIIMDNGSIIADGSKESILNRLRDGKVTTETTKTTKTTKDQQSKLKAVSSS